jgi:hypothetical protein
MTVVFPNVLLTQCSNTVLEVTVFNTVFAQHADQSSIAQFFAHHVFALNYLLLSITYSKRKS